MEGPSRDSDRKGPAALADWKSAQATTGDIDLKLTLDWDSEMTHPELLSTAFGVIIAALVVWHYRSNWRYQEPPDMAIRQRRYKIGWEIRGLVLVVGIMYGTAMIFGFLSGDYLCPLILFLVAGLLLADMFAPSGLFRGM
jgi:hypothetical protein